MPVRWTIRFGLLSISAAATLAPFPGVAGANPVPGMEVLDETSSCTAGFAAEGGGGTYYLMTSGHCDSGDGSVWTDGNDNPLGRIIASENNGGDRDTAAIMLIPAAGVPSGDVAGHRVTGVLNPDQIAVGTTLCKLGAQTGQTCGDVTAVTGNVIDANVFSTEGDSGSAGFVVNPDGTASAVGILAGGPEGDDTKSYFIAIGPLLSQWGLRLLP